MGPRTCPSACRLSWSARAFQRNVILHATRPCLPSSCAFAAFTCCVAQPLLTGISFFEVCALCADSTQMARCSGAMLNEARCKAPHDIKPKCRRLNRATQMAPQRDAPHSPPLPKSQFLAKDKAMSSSCQRHDSTRLQRQAPSQSKKKEPHRAALADVFHAHFPLPSRLFHSGASEPQLHPLVPLQLAST